MLIFKIGHGACSLLFGLYRSPILPLCISKTKSLFNYLSYRTKNRWCSVDDHLQNGARSMSLLFLGWNTANMSFMIVCIQLPPRLPMMQEQKSLARRWLSCSGWGRECVTCVFIYKGSCFTRKGQWRTKINILRFAVGYLNATINWKTRNMEPEIGTDGSTQTQQNLQFDMNQSGFGLPTGSGSGFWTALDPIQTVFPVRTRTAGGLPGPVANTISTKYIKAHLVYPHLSGFSYNPSSHTNSTTRLMCSISAFSVLLYINQLSQYADSK